MSPWSQRNSVIGRSPGMEVGRRKGQNDRYRAGSPQQLGGVGQVMDFINDDPAPAQAVKEALRVD
jgi:hypothetical protein